jgi:hypothetical protein
MLLERFYHYTFLDNSLIGSEHPAIFGNARPILDHFVGKLGIRALITLTPGFQDFRYPNLTQYHIPIHDMPSVDQVSQAIEVIRQHHSRKEPVWVHCQHGLDRTGCVIGSYLASLGQPPGEVIAELYGKFPERRRNSRMIALWEPYEAMIRSFRAVGDAPKSS